MSRVSTYNTKFQWGSQRELLLQVKHQNYPLNLECLFTSPWQPAKHVEGSLIWDGDSANRRISFTAKDPAADATTAKFQLNVVGDLQNFNHEMDGEWYSKTMRITVSGGLNGFSDSNLHTIVKLPKHHISYDFLSKKEADTYIGEFKADVDNAITAGGVKWDFSGVQEKTASIWGQVPNRSPAIAILEFDNTNGKTTTKVKVNCKDDSVIDMVSVIQVTGLRYWNMDFVLKSAFLVIPSISMSSQQNILDLKDIQHKTTMRLVPQSEEGFWLNDFNITTRHASVDLSITNLEDIEGALIFGKTDFVVVGKIERDNGNGYTSNIKIASNQFHELVLTGSYLQDENQLVLSGKVKTLEDDVTLLKINLDSSKTDEERSGKISLETKYTPPLEAFIAMSTQGNCNFTTYLLKNSENVFNFNANGIVSINL